MEGYAGFILHVDLDKATFEQKPLPQDYKRDFIGGEGISARLAHDLIPPDCDALSPANVMIFGAGPFVGTMVPGAAKTVVMAKSPLTGFLGRSATGDRFGMLKFAGYDHLVIKGRAPKPVVLKVTSEEVALLPASHLCKKDNWETAQALWEELGEDYTVASIGPAGENLVRQSSIIVNAYSAYGRTGLGAVMGSKNLKAIVIKGDRMVKVADRKRFAAAARQVLEKLRAHPNLSQWRSLGTLISLADFGRTARYPHQYYRTIASEKMLDNFNTDIFLQRIKKSDISCLACPVGCKHNLEIQGGDYSGHSLGVSCFNVVIQNFAAQCGLDNWDDTARCVELTNRLGMDIIDTANTVAFVTDLFERGVISERDTDGLQLKWGSAPAIHQLIQKIALREGFGDILADGPVEASRRIGREAEKYLVHVKGMTTGSDPRPRLAPETFSSFICFRGPSPSFVGITLIPRDPDSVKRYGQRIGIPPGVFDSVFDDSPEGYNIPKLTHWSENYYTAMQNLGVCVFPLFQRLGIDTWAELYSALTGVETSPSDLHRASERTWNLEKWFNVLAGATRQDDRCPNKFVSEWTAFGNKEYPPLDAKYLEALIDEYYQDRGWDPKEFVPTRSTLRELGLEEVIKLP